MYDINGNVISYSTAKGQWRKANATVYAGKSWKKTNNTYVSVSAQTSSLYYEFNGEKKVRICAETGGSDIYPAYAFVDSSGNVIKESEWVKNGYDYTNVVEDVPSNAYAIHVNGQTLNCSCYLEVLVDDLMADSSFMEYLARTFARKLTYNKKFVWKTMNKPHIAFVFDDSQPNISNVVDLFTSKNVPCCFACIPEYINKGCVSGETVAEAMMRGVKDVGCEVLAHGGQHELITDSVANDMNKLYSKFIISNQKFFQMGFNVRGCMTVGGTGKIMHDARIDPWVKLVYDYCDEYGLEEPYYHLRKSSTGETGWRNIITQALAKNEFTSLCFHTPPDYLEDLIDMAIDGGAEICTYAYVYDKYGSYE